MGEGMRLFDEIQDKKPPAQLASEHKSQFLASMGSADEPKSITLLGSRRRRLVGSGATHFTNVVGSDGRDSGRFQPRPWEDSSA
jgi:hypothetical protein